VPFISYGKKKNGLLQSLIGGKGKPALEKEGAAASFLRRRRKGLLRRWKKKKSVASADEKEKLEASGVGELGGKVWGLEREGSRSPIIITLQEREGRKLSLSLPEKGEK